MAQRRYSSRRRRRRSIMEAALSIGMVIILVLVLVICILATKSCGDKEEKDTTTTSNEVTTDESLTTGEDDTSGNGETTSEKETTTEVETTTEKPTTPPSGVISSLYGDQVCNEGKFIVCIDPGHGGRDGGTANLAGDRLEKDDVLRLSFAIKKEMEALGIQVVMTRETDIWVDKDLRPQIANQAKADVLLSIHRNSYGKNTVSGYEAWIASEANSNSADLARAILKGIQESGISKNRGVKEGTSGNAKNNYYINSLSSMPSMILEMGYMTSEVDNQLFDEKLNDHAKVIADTVYAWLNSH